MVNNNPDELLNTEMAEGNFANADTILEAPAPSSMDDDATLDETLDDNPSSTLPPLRPPPSGPSPFKTGQLFDGYMLLEALGAGTFGVVFKASKENQVFALKILKAETENKEVIDRFKREAKVLAQLDHPNILKIHDFGVADGRPYLALEFIEGLSLRQSMKAGDYPSYDEARVMMAAVASGLAHCHSKGIVHRDLKPGNIIVEKGSGRPVIVDFGLVYKDDRRLRSGELVGFTKNLSIKGFIKGTPQFMSPEQADPDALGAVGAASDVWSFGATLYNLLTRELLFPNHKGLEVLEPLANGRIPKVQSVAPDIPRQLAQLCQLCLQLESIHRPTMFELAKFLKGSERAFHERRVTGVLTRPKPEKQKFPLIPFILAVVGITSFVLLYLYFAR